MMATVDQQPDRQRISHETAVLTLRSTGACHGSSSQIVRSQVAVCGPIPRHRHQHLQTFLSHAASRRQRTGIRTVFTYLFWLRARLTQHIGTYQRNIEALTDTDSYRTKQKH